MDIDLFPGEILGVLGPNGAGKTVFFNLVSGIYTPTGGQIYFEGRRIDGFAPHMIAEAGIGRTFQIVKPLKSLTVLENVLVAFGVGLYGRLWQIWGRWASAPTSSRQWRSLKR